MSIITITSHTMPCLLNRVLHSPILALLQNSPMAKLTPRRRSFSCSGEGVAFLSGLLFTLLSVWTLWSSWNPLTLLLHPLYDSNNTDLVQDPPDRTFYDDPELSYAIEKPLKNWDQKRNQWPKLRPSLAAGAKDRILLVTGSEPEPCKNPIGDHLLPRTSKNKVDYCPIHGYDIPYNNFYLIRASMIAHPEVEWTWWMDSDAVFMDMEFEVPLDRYKNHNSSFMGGPIWCTRTEIIRLGRA
ncbi:hypothetical protein L6164_027931 [Bauhinia variegata]|uniref:Uncharacterized protein n=1 Tax=Bauhinia variegata TaxID=167791 RepID=A0ACB9LUE7_BAUVA|nr:hypothetical protein L6164_027931 [Bauhinia variegata]